MLIGFVYKLIGLRCTGPDPARLALCATLGLSCLSFVVSTPVTWVFIDGVLGYPNISALIAQMAVMTLIALQQVIVIYWSSSAEAARKHTQRWLSFFTCIIAVLVMLFFMMDSSDQAPKNFTLRFVQDPYYATYLTIYIVLYTVGESIVAISCFRFAVRAKDRALAWGLRIAGAGCVVTFGYSAVRAADIVAALNGVTLTEWENFAWVCGNSGALLTVFGWIFPGLRSVMPPNTRRWIEALEQRHRLTPLRLAMRAATPEVPHTPANWPLMDVFTTKGQEFHLFREAVEIRDAQLMLRQYSDPRIAATVMEVAAHYTRTQSELETIVEAAQIKAAINAKDASQTPVISESAVAAASRAGSVELSEEISSLILVAEAFESCPIIQETVDQIDVCANPATGKAV